MKLQAHSLIGFAPTTTSGPIFRAVAAATGQAIEPDFYAATPADVERAATLAAQAFPIFAAKSATERARFLRLIADKMDAAKDELTVRAGRETGLPVARCNGEIARTTGQLRLFAKVIEDGSWVEARLESGDAERKPVPKPDLRSMLVPLGPVAVFGASNFPFAYSVAGGDTASALAAGCPVVVKAHPAHPGTSEITAQIILDAAQESGMPEGVFSLLFDGSIEIGVALVRHQAIKAVGFTGSRRAGRALMDAAAARDEPIPVYAEMSSVNPLFLWPSAVENDVETLVDGLCASITNGAGQFCTKPGLVFLPQSEKSEHFVSNLSEKLAQIAPMTMLTTGIGSAYGKGVTRWEEDAQVETVLAPQLDAPLQTHAALFQTSGAEFLANRALMDEVFGPAALIVHYENDAQLQQIAHALEGQLTFSLHGTEDEIAHSELVPLAVEKAGRVVFNGFPTGVEVGDAIVHGGPYPATSDGRTSSVGSRALTRWARYVAWQNAPQKLLPLELQDANPLGIKRMVNGEAE